MSDWEQLKESYRTLGPTRFIAMSAGTIGWMVAGVWLMLKAVWPGTCDHSGRKIVALMKELYCSPELLSSGPIEKGLFVWLWSAPALVLAVLVYALIRKARTADHSLYSDDTE